MLSIIFLLLCFDFSHSIRVDWLGQQYDVEDGVRTLKLISALEAKMRRRLKQIH